MLCFSVEGKMTSFQFSGSNNNPVLKNQERERTDMVIGKEHQMISIQTIVSYLRMLCCFPALTDVRKF